MLSQNKTVNYVVGGIAIASLALFAYTVTRPTRETKKRKTKRKHKHKNKKDSDGSKSTSTFNKKPIGVHLVMETMDGFNAHVAGDKKNQKLGLKYGSRLIKINDKRVENLSYEEIFEILQKTKTPITLQFRQLNDLCLQWSKAERLKEDANIDYKNEKTESAINKVSGAIELHPTNKIYYSNRILMYLNCQKYDYALKDCQMIRELDPKSMYIKGHYLRGLTLLKLKKYKNAASAFQTVVKLNPSFKKATDRLNECLVELEKDNKVNEKRRSSKQEQLKQQFQQKDDDEKKQDDIAPNVPVIIPPKTDNKQKEKEQEQEQEQKEEEEEEEEEQQQQSTEEPIANEVESTEITQELIENEMESEPKQQQKQEQESPPKQQQEQESNQ